AFLRWGGGAVGPPRRRTLLRVPRPGTADAWCEDPRDRNYNRPIRLADAAAGDRLWRGDHLYDFLIELDHNTRPRVAGRGSAVFVHLARPGFRPTAGCVALPPASFRRLPSRLGLHPRFVIESSRRPRSLLAALAEDRGTDAHVGRTEFDCERKIGTHSHREQRKPVARRDFLEQPEMRCRRLLERREAHQSLDR